MEEKLIELKQRLEEITDLNMASSVLGWDQFNPYARRRGGSARAPIGYVGEDFPGTSNG